MSNLNNQKILTLAAEIQAGLLEPASDSWQALERRAKTALEEAMTAGEEHDANRLWFLYGVIDARLQYVTSFQQIKREAYYESWCGLERVEIKLRSLSRNALFDLDDFGINPLAATIQRWQKLFPYAVFFSPEIVAGRKECSICTATVDPWTDCGHKPGHLYCGKECYRIVRDPEILSISLVRNPVQKYSVAFVRDDAGRDQFDYSLVRFVADRLASPFDAWSLKWEEALHPHELFADRPADAACPCGSGRAYGRCCLPKRGVLRPHASIGLKNPPHSPVPRFAFAGYGAKNGPAEATLFSAIDKEKGGG
jgi:SEC-C motif